LWMKSTWDFFIQIFPLLLAGVFLAGIIKMFVPPEFIAKWVGLNTVSANLIASVLGAFSYFATLTEVPIVKALTDLGMAKGPSLALLLAGPSLSLPNMIVISRIMGLKRALTYIVLVIVMASLTGLIIGNII
ncbi:MAG: permease, partial [Spirochaetes bacterium]